MTRSIALVASLTPLVVGIWAGAPALATASLFSTLAIAVHDGERFIDQWRAVARAYIGAAALAAGAAGTTLVLGVPVAITAAVAAAMIAMASAGRVHPPTAGLPLALVGHDGALNMVGALALGLVGVAYGLLVLRLVAGARYGVRHMLASLTSASRTVGEES